MTARRARGRDERRSVEVATQRKGKWVVFGLSPIGVNGRFSRVIRLPCKPGVYPYRVTLFGDDEHRPSGRTVSIGAV